MIKNEALAEILEMVKEVEFVEMEKIIWANY
jgi:hypothetical protein